jgi:hypothetical protein
MTTPLKPDPRLTAEEVLGGIKTPSDYCRAERESAKSILERKIKNLYKQANDLEIILNSLPTRPTLEQDIAFYHLFERL